MSESEVSPNRIRAIVTKLILPPAYIRCISSPPFKPVRLVITDLSDLVRSAYVWISR